MYSLITSASKVPGLVGAMAIAVALVAIHLFFPYQGMSIEVEVVATGSTVATLQTSQASMKRGNPRARAQAHIYPGRHVYFFTVSGNGSQSLMLNFEASGPIKSISPLRVKYNNKDVAEIPAERFSFNQAIFDSARISGRNLDLGFALHGGALNIFVPAQAIPPQTSSGVSIEGLLLSVLWVALGWILIYGRERLGVVGAPDQSGPTASQFSASMLFIAMACAVAMVFVSNFGTLVHPDEVHHFAASRYYFNHWLIPKPGSIDMLPSLTDYGNSFLFEPTFAYLLVGKFTLAFLPIFKSEYLAGRAFQVSMLAVLVFVCARNPKRAMYFVPLLFVPQVWYLFSYVNSDALGLFAGILLCYELLVEQRTGLSAMPKNKVVGLAVYIGFLFALIMMSKRNYAFTAAFVVLAFALKHQLGSRQGIIFLAVSIACFAPGYWLYASVVSGKLTVYWLTFLVTSGVALVLSVRGFLYPVFQKVVFGNEKYYLEFIVVCFVALGLLIGVKFAELGITMGGDQRAVLDSIKTTYASPRLNPTFGFKPPAAHDLSIYDLFAADWAGISFRSFFGTFGYMNIESPFALTAILGALLAVFFLFGLYSVSRETQGFDGLSSLVMIFVASVVTTSICYSWAYDFQPQGRYLFPFLPVIGVAVAYSAYSGYSLLFRGWFIITGFIVSAYIFFAVALANISKVTG